MTRYVTVVSVIVALVAGTCMVATAGPFDNLPIPGGGDVPDAGDILERLNVRIPDLRRILDEPPAIATSFDDAVYGVPFLDELDPIVTAPMRELPFTGDGRFIMACPGMYELEAMSFCLHAGTYGPGQGAGHLYAPLRGKLAGVIQDVLDNYMAHPEIDQRRVQSLIWGIQAKTKIRDMPDELREVARTLLSDRQLRELNGGALGMVPEELFDDAFVDVPDEVRMVLEAEARLRERLTGEVYDFEALEEVAVLSGDPPAEEGGLVIPRGRWSFDPAGYFVRYMPHGYPRTTLQLYDPEPFEVVADGLGRITRIVNAAGSAIEPVYAAGDGGPVGGDGDVRSFALTAIRLLSPDGQATQVQCPAEIATLVGLPSGGGRPSGSAGDAYDAATETLRQVRELAGHVEGASPDSELVGNVIDLAHFTDALERVVAEAGGGAEALRPWLNMSRRTWASELFLVLQGAESGETMQTRFRGDPVRLASLSLPGGLWSGREIMETRIAYNPGEMEPLEPQPYPYWGPSGGTGTPANRKGQRLGQSGNSHRELPDFKPDAGDDDDEGTPTGGQGKEAFEKAQKAIEWIGTGQDVVGVVTDPVGTAADKMGFGIRDQMMGGFFDFIFDSSRTISEQMGGDPPRDDYTELAEPESITVPTLAAEDALSAEHAAALNTLAASMAEQLSLLRAGLICRDRIGGALAAGDDEWAMRQSAALIDYKHEIGLKWMEIGLELRAVLDAIEAAGINDLVITEDAAAEYLARLRTEGFTEEELAAAQVLGLTPAELQGIRQQRRSVSPAQMAGSMVEHGEELATALRTLGASWASLPAENAGWWVEAGP